ncbi:MAG: response regulator transcription factor [Flavobacteriales bacterium]|jgi:DNA-binding NarL/FixJ family response regulator|nr:response regulator transcription factor [Flavobacteriales bacterium]MCI1752675.1 response regulator transcription factor [Flavobacteriales bacterium]
MNDLATVRILVVDAQKLVAEGLEQYMAVVPKIDIVGHAFNGEDLLSRLTDLQVDLLMMDVSLPKMDGIDTMRMLHKKSPGLKVLAYSALSEIEYVNSMLIEGASGYLIKGGTAEEVVLAVETVMDGGCYISPLARASIDRGYKHTGKRIEGEYVGLTTREREIIRLIALEQTNTEIAAALFIGEETVKTHRKNLMQKLNVRSAAGLVKYAVDRCWV